MSLTPDQVTRSTMIGPFPLPEINEELREQARSKSNDWVAIVDPMVRPDVTEPPAYAVQGGYYVDNQGQFTGQYQVNPGYCPHPNRAGVRFANGLELTLWRVLNGFNPLGTLADSFYHAELVSYARYPDDNGIVLIDDPENPGTQLFLAYTSQQFCQWEQHSKVEGSQILELMGKSSTLLEINPGAKLNLRLPMWVLAHLITADTPYLRERTAEQGQG
ncbi:hypothetical protein J2S53_003703 [Actinopolyspora lacussalsi]|nr:hypothetical protein [Actinopolyspora lacussalsi]